MDILSFYFHLFCIWFFTVFISLFVSFCMSLVCFASAICGHFSSGVLLLWSLSVWCQLFLACPCHKFYFLSIFNHSGLFVIILQKPFVLYFVVCVLCVQLGLFFFSLFVSFITTIRFLSFTVEVYGAASLLPLLDVRGIADCGTSALAWRFPRSDPSSSIRISTAFTPPTRRSGFSAWKHRKLIGTGGRHRRSGLAGFVGVD